MTMVFVKLLLALLLTFSAFAIINLKSLKVIFYKDPLKYSIAIAVVVRVALFILVYGILHQPVVSDVPTFYYPQALAAQAGGVWNLTFISSYSPLFPWVGAFLIGVWHTPLIFVVVALCLDVLTLWLWSKVTASFESDAANAVSLVYALSGPVILNALVGQQQIWIGAGLAASVLLLRFPDREIYSGLIQGVTFCVTKLLALLFWPILFLASEKRVKWVVSALIVCVFAFGYFLILGSSMLEGLRKEEQLISSANIPYYSDYFLQIAPSLPIYNAILLLVMISAYLFLFLRLQSAPARSDDRIRVVTIGVALVMVLFLLMSKKSFSNYLGFAYFPMLFVLYRGLPAAWFWSCAFLLSAAGSIQTSLLFASRGNGLALRDWVSQAGLKPVLPVMATELVLMGLYALIAALAIRMLQNIPYKKLAAAVR